MKAILAALVALVMLAAPVMASTQIWAELTTTGNTNYLEYTTHGGTNWQRVGDTEQGNWYVDTPSTVPHLWVTEGFTNVGSIHMDKYVNAPAEWNLQEYKSIMGSGDTTINKEVLWTTNTRSVDENGLLGHPTQMKIDVTFATPVPFYDYESVNAITNIPPAQTLQYFGKTIITNDMFQFTQRIGDNMDLLANPFV